MTAPAKPGADRTMTDALLSPSLRAHLLIVGAALFVAGAATLWLLPEVSALWVVIAVVVVSHVGLLMVAGAAILRGAASRRRGV
ncbi:MAG: hypothetical protein GY722_00425 [bacterium]|nr:hypothetical protein [bacterium]